MNIYFHIDELKRDSIVASALKNCDTTVLVGSHALIDDPSL